jgi:hypothetical protein
VAEEPKPQERERNQAGQALHSPPFAALAAQENRSAPLAGVQVAYQASDCE